MYQRQTLFIKRVGWSWKAKLVENDAPQMEECEDFDRIATLVWRCRITSRKASQSDSLSMIALSSKSNLIGLIVIYYTHFFFLQKVHRAEITVLSPGRLLLVWDIEGGTSLVTHIWHLVFLQYDLGQWTRIDSTEYWRPLYFLHLKRNLNKSQRWSLENAILSSFVAR